MQKTAQNLRVLGDVPHSDLTEWAALDFKMGTVKMSDAFLSVTVPVRLIGSHGQNVPGFRSVLHGIFATATEEPPHFVETVSISKITVLGLDVERLHIGAPSNDGPQGWQLLEVHFKELHTSETIKKFLHSLATALSASFASKQLDPWYGNLVVEVDWSSMHLTKQPTATEVLEVDIWSSLTSKDYKALTAQGLSSLKTSDLAEIFVDGMRANQPKSKYSNWFIPLEELERLANTKFSHLFTPLFSGDERDHIAKASSLSGDQIGRLKSFLGNPNHTIENRADKLYTILKEIDLLEWTVIGGKTITVDLAVCDRLIKGRNSLAHKGTKVDEDLLYNVLFPLSCRVLSYLTT